MVPGHEIIGNVVAVAEGEKAWKVGDRIGGAWHGGHDGESLRYSFRCNEIVAGLISLPGRQVRARPAKKACFRCATTSWSTVLRNKVDVS